MFGFGNTLISAILGFLTGVALLLHASTMHAQDQLRRRVVAEVPRAYEQYRDFAVTLQGRADIRENIDRVYKEEKVQTWRYFEVKMNKDCASSLLQFMDQDRYEGSLVVQNPSYRFQLKRKSCDGEWVLTSVDRNVNELGLEAAMSAKTQVQQILHYAFKIYDLSVPDILSEKNGSKVDRISAVTRDGKELVQVDFDATHPVKAPEGGVFSPTQGGTFWLDPSRHWCVVEYKLRAEWGGQTKVTIESSWLVRTSHCRTSGKRTFARVGNSCRLRSCGPWMPAVVDRKKAQG